MTLGIPSKIALTCTPMYVSISIAAISSLQKVVIYACVTVCELNVLRLSYILAFLSK